MITELFETDISEITSFETKAFPAGLQASAETYRKRFRLGHIMLGYRPSHDVDTALQGVISFSYGCFTPDDPSTIPDNFKDWSSQPVPKNFDTVFIYNLGRLPQTRGIGAVRALTQHALDRAKRDGCRQAVAEGPIPSYAGNDHARPNPEIRHGLDAFARGGSPPPPDLLFKDPHLALYRQLCPCAIIRVLPNFLPADAASGGFRAMLFRDLRDFIPRLPAGAAR